MKELELKLFLWQKKDKAIKLRNKVALNNDRNNFGKQNLKFQ